MLKELKFVQGSVAKKDYIPALTHFEIKDGVIKGYNGSLALSSPIDIDLHVKPKAIPFVKAIQACKSAVQLSVTPTGRLSIKSGSFKAYVECTDEVFPDLTPTGTLISLEGIDFIPALKKLLAFTGEDASRKWAQGIMLKDDKAYATNNIILAEYTLPVSFPVAMNIPRTAVAELVRIATPPVGVMVSDTSATFMYSENMWIRTQLYDLGWPDLNKVLSREADYLPVDNAWFDAVEAIAPFTDDLQRVFFSQDTISSASENGAAGGTVQVEGFPYTGVFNYKYFLSLKGLVTEIDLHAYPAPCLFKGEHIRGAIMGMAS